MSIRLFSLLLMMFVVVFLSRGAQNNSPGETLLFPQIRPSAGRGGGGQVAITLTDTLSMGCLFVRPLLDAPLTISGNLGRVYSLSAV